MATRPRRALSGPAVPLRPASYARISADRADDQLGVKRQEKANGELARKAGWPKLRPFVDNDTSAYSGKVRPAYRELLDGIRSGEVDGLVVWHVDRLYRRPVELEELIDLLDARPGFPFLTVTAGEIDLASAAGRMMARTLTTLARYESEHKGERLRAKHAELALAGKGKGGGTRPFGFGPDRVSIDKTEARLIRSAADAVLAGASLRSVCADWNTKGVATVTGRPWTSTVMRTMLTSARIAGLRSHHGEVVADADWGAIVDRTTHERLRAILLDPSRSKRTRPARRYLLTGGLARCGLCDAALVARPRGDGRRCYVCAAPPNFSGCGAIRILAEPFEEWVTEVLLAALDSPELAEALADDDLSSGLVADELAGIEARLAELAELYASETIGRAEWMTARRGLTERADEQRRLLRQSQGARAARSLLGTGEVLRSGWETMELDARRAIVAAAVDRVVVGPAVRGRNFFDAERLSIVWRV